MKSLIVYYSLTNGNTKRIAEMLQQATQADIAEIQTVTPYTGGYDAVVAQGQEEVNRGYEPEIQPLSVSVADYDRIFIGTPTWWYTMAPAVRTFLHQQNFSGKTVIPFMTNGGWPGHTIADMKTACRGAAFAHEKKFSLTPTAVTIWKPRCRKSNHGLLQFVQTKHRRKPYENCCNYRKPS